MIDVNESEIIDEDYVCVYCYEKQTNYSCCGENHFEKGYFTKENCYLDNEINIINENEVKND